MKGLALTWPTADEVEHHAKTLLAVGSVLGGAWAICLRLWKRHKARKAQRDLEARAIRYLLDAMRHSLNVLLPRDERHLVDADELIRQKLLIDEVRDQLWVADGHESQRAAEQAAADIVRVLTRTQAIKAKVENNPFKDGWTPDK